ncbi:Swarming motility protein SwrC [Paenibacillus solanacearum]|uniref:Swarming motility protein SwrC n=1 Tax=Paenibacillus solanacearum TaxID=2048548 RepID=A0A916NSL5_9BACL|nr:efflux RND transporter permease subunit [Paenibacillus solanacearum]CAG7650156.1 Swarming motility protein SwrC [Paenibacillus solanacearum]
MFTRFSLNNVSAVIILIVMLALGGSYMATQLQVESVPNIDFPAVTVRTAYPAPPEDVMKYVTEPIEEEIQGLDGLKNLSSVSDDNISLIVVQLEDGVDTDKAKKDIESLINRVELPQAAKRPVVSVDSPVTQPVYYLGLSSADGVSRSELSRLLNDRFLPGLRSIRGIERIETVGDDEDVLYIRLDPNALQQFGLTPTQVAGWVRGSLADAAAGTVNIGGNDQMLRVKGKFAAIYDLHNMQLVSSRGDVVLLGQLAAIRTEHKASFVSRLNGEPNIAIHLYKNEDANIIELIGKANELLDRWKRDYPSIKFDIVIDGSAEIKKSISGMLREGGFGAALASLMILLFLRNARMTLIALVSIPVSIFATLIFMKLIGLTINIFSLGGMVIAIGRIVDDSIVVIENIYSQLQKAQQRNDSVLLLATGQVSKAITSSTVTTVGVFAPLGLVSGPPGQLFSEFALTISCALLASLLVALTVIPVLCKLLVLRGDGPVKHEEHKETGYMRMYRRLLIVALNRRAVTLLVAFVLLLASVGGTAPFLKKEFLPSGDTEKTMRFDLKLPRETSLDTMDAKLKTLEDMMREGKDEKGAPLFKTVEGLAGYNWNKQEYPYRASILAEVYPETDAKPVLKAYVDKIKYELPQGSEAFGTIVKFGPPTTNKFEYMLKSDNQDDLKAAAALVKEELKKVPEMSNVKDSFGDLKREVQVLVDPAKARQYGLTTASVLESVNSWIAEVRLGDITFEGVEYSTRVRVDEAHLGSIGHISALQLKTPAGRAISLRDIAEVREVGAPSSIERDQQRRYVSITADVEGNDVGGVSSRAAERLAALPFPDGVERELKGAQIDIEEAFSDMIAAIVSAVFIVYLVMVLTFGNASSPFAILFSLPLAAIGGFLGVVIAREAISVTSLIGFLMLIGIVVTNAIVLVDRVEQLRHEGMSVREALVEAGVTRLRPIIMTAGATIIALIPLVLGESGGAIISKGLAVVVMGGLTTSTLLTLVVVPAIYELIASALERMRSRGRRSKSKPLASESSAVPGP